MAARRIWYFLVLISLSLAQEVPVKGDNGETGGIFGIGSLMGNILGGGPGKLPPIPNLFITGPEAPPPGAPKNTDGGSGPYKAGPLADASLPKHTIYAPLSPPPSDVELPVIVWGNGGCFSSNLLFADFLTEIASHGYLVLANGDFVRPPRGIGTDPTGGLLGALRAPQTKVSMLTDSIDWVKGGKGAKYGNINTNKIAAAGQSCGGLEAYSASYHDDRVKLTVLFNSGVLDDKKTYLLKELKAPVAYFLGGPSDIAYKNGERDFDILSSRLPVVKANLDTGHMGTYTATGGGKFGKAAVAYFQWQFRGDHSAKKKFIDPSVEGSLVKDHWNVTLRGY